MKKLGRSFYTRPALAVARKILGKYIVRVWRGRKIVGKIVEVEVYYGPRDRASHAYGGKRTERNRAEYFKGGLQGTRSQRAGKVLQSF
jgi:DNA-3-methyladenine glycosylase